MLQGTLTLRLSGIPTNHSLPWIAYELSWENQLAGERCAYHSLTTIVSVEIWTKNFPAPKQEELETAGSKPLAQQRRTIRATAQRSKPRSWAYRYSSKAANTQRRLSSHKQGKQRKLCFLLICNRIQLTAPHQSTEDVILPFFSSVNISILLDKPLIAS